jgi:hypothetical protein
MKQEPYNGHKNWAHWNVALWIGNDEGIYNLAIHCIRKYPSLDKATRAFITELGTEKTPDGARYSKVAVRAALADLKEE